MALVVDDDSFSRELFSEMLMALGVGDIRTASGGRIALRTLVSLPRPPDELICDVFLPDMNGIEFLLGLGITVTAIAQEMAIADGLKLLGAYTKPVPRSVLAQVLLQVDA